MVTKSTGKRELPPNGRPDEDQTSRCRVHDVLRLSERPYLGHGESSFKYPKYPKRTEKKPIGQTKGRGALFQNIREDRNNHTAGTLSKED
jgi:hypothetical protein